MVPLPSGLSLLSALPAGDAAGGSACAQAMRPGRRSHHGDRSCVMGQCQPAPGPGEAGTQRHGTSGGRGRALGSDPSRENQGGRCRRAGVGAAGGREPVISAGSGGVQAVSGACGAAWAWAGAGPAGAGPAGAAGRAPAIWVRESTPSRARRHMRSSDPLGRAFHDRGSRGRGPSHPVHESGNSDRQRVAAGHAE